MNLKEMKLDGIRGRLLRNQQEKPFKTQVLYQDAMYPIFDEPNLT